MNVTQQLQHCLNDPAWLPFKLDLAAGKVLLVKVPERDVRQTAFLDERVLQPQSEGYWVTLDDFAQVEAPAPQASALFHVGHCGSTLISRLLGETSQVRALREPLVMRELAAAKASQADGSPRWFRVFWGWLSRSQQKPVHIKLTSACANLMPWFLMLDQPAVALYVDLETYLTGMSRGGGAGKDVTAFAQQRQLEWQQLYPGARPPQSHAELAAGSWLVSMTHFLNARGADPRLVHLLCFDDWLTDIDRSMTELTNHYGWPPPQAPVASHPLLNQYAKQTDVAYDARARQADLALARSRYGQFIDEGLRWVSTIPELEHLEQFTRPGRTSQP